MKVVYIKDNGNIIGGIPGDVDYRIIFSKRGEDFVNSLDSILIDDDIDNLKYYYIEDATLTRRIDYEIEEINNYGRVLSSEERLDILLKPSQEEIAKAESTIDILLTLQEVGLI